MAKYKVKVNKLIDNLVAHYKLNDNSTIDTGLFAYFKMNDNAADQVVVNEKGANVTWAHGNTEDHSVAGKVNSALEFNGTDDIVAIGNPGPLKLNDSSNGFSISIWIYPHNITSHRSIVCKGATTASAANAFDYELYLENDGKVSFRVSNGATAKGGASPSSALTINAWNHVVGTWDGTTAANAIKTYVDTVLKRSNTSTFVIADMTTTHDLNISAIGAGRGFDGVIDDVRIYNRALSVGEISALYNVDSGTDKEAFTVVNETGTVSNLIAHWKMDDNFGNTNVLDSAGSNSGTASQNTAAMATDGQVGGALHLNGSTDQIDIAHDNVLNLGPNLTVTAWVNLDATGNYMEIVNKASGSSATTVPYRLYVQDDGKVKFGISDGSNGDYITSGAALNTTQWYHLVGTADGSNLNLYIDGIPETPVAQTFVPMATNSAILTLGRWGDDGGTYYPFDGKLDDVRLYNKTLTSAEVNIVMNEMGDGVLVGGDNTQTKHVAGKIRGAFDFNGSTDYVDTGQTFQTTFQDSFSISVWAKPDDGQPAEFDILIGSTEAANEDQVYLDINTNGTVDFRYEANGNGVSTTTSAACFTDGTQDWHHILITATSGGGATGIKVYFDGALRACTGGDVSSITFGDFVTDQNLYIGGYNQNGVLNYEFAGGLDDVRIYNKAISQDEVDSIYNNGRGTESETPTVAAKEKQSLDWDVRSDIVAQYKMNDDALVDNSLIVYYKLNDDAADTVVVNEKGPNGVYTGANTEDRTVAGVINKALIFDGTNDYVTCGDIGDMGLGDMTVAFWVYQDINPKFGTCLHKGASSPGDVGWHVGMSDYGKVQVVFGDGITNINTYANEGTEVPATTWTHVAVVFDRDANVDTYVNGVISAANSRDISAATGDIISGNDLFLGVRHNLTLDLEGRLDDARIYNRVLSQGEIAALYNAGNGTEEEAIAVVNEVSTIVGLVAHYKLNDDAADTVVVDSGSGATNGTLGGGDNTQDLSITGKINTALDFNGTDDYVDTNQQFDVTDTNVLTGSFSISCWIKPDDGQPSGLKYLFGSYMAGGADRIYLSLDASGKLLLSYYSDGDFGNNAYTASAVFSDGATAWTHVVCVLDSTVGGIGGKLIYVNGTLQMLDGANDGSTAGVTFADFVTTQNFYFGGLNLAGSLEPFAGGYDDFRIYNKALTAEEVIALYNGGSGSEKEGFIIPSEQGNNAGLVGGNPTAYKHVAGKNQGAIDFDGTSDYVDTGQTFESTIQGSFSIGLWFKPDDGQPAGTQRLFGNFSTNNEDACNTYLNDAGNLIFQFYSNNNGGTFSFTGVTLDDGQETWHHMAIVADSTIGGVGGIKLYFDGSVVNSTGDTTGITFADYVMDENFMIGAFIYTSTVQNFFAGPIDNFCIFNKALSADEVGGLYNQGRGTEQLAGNLAKLAPTNTWDLSSNVIAQYKLNDNASTDPNLVAHWKMNDDAANPIVVDVKNAGNGTFSDAGGDPNTDAHTVAGKINTALTFDGTDDWVDTNSIFQSTFRDSFSFSMWVKPSDGHPTGNDYMIGGWCTVGDDSGTGMILYTTGQISLVYMSEGNFGNNAKSAAAVFSDGAETWHHIVGVADSTIGGIGGKKLYFDGELIALDATDNGNTTGVDFSEFTSTMTLAIGATHQGGSFFMPFGGDIDDVRIYNTALPSGVIAGIYNAGNGTEEEAFRVVNSADITSGLVAHYTMDDDAANGIVINEESANGSWAHGNTEDHTIAGKIGTALDCDGTNDYIDCNQTYQSILGDSFSISMWVKPDDGHPAATVVLCGSRDAGADNNIYPYIKTDGALQCTYGAGGTGMTTLVSNVVFSDGAETWHHVVLTIDSTDGGKFYFDGSDATLSGGSLAGTTMSDFVTDQNFFISGRNQAGLVSPVAGGIDDFRIYNRTLTPAEVGALYSITSDAGLVGGDNTQTKHVAGKIHGAFDFNGTDDYVDCGQAFESTFQDSFSIGLWVKPDNGQVVAFQHYFGSNYDDTDRVLGFQYAGYIYFTLESDNVSIQHNNSISFDAGVNDWCHIVYVVDATIESLGGIKIYRNGVKDAVDGNTAGIVSANFGTTRNLFLGGLNNKGTPADFFDGGIDNACVFNKALTAKEVWGLYNTGRGTEKLKDLG